MAAALRHIRGNTYYLPGTTNVGVVVNGNQCVIIDTGRTAGMENKLPAF